MKYFLCLFLIIILTPLQLQAMEFHVLYGAKIKLFDADKINSALDVVYAIETSPMEVIDGIPDESISKLKLHMSDNGKYLEIYMSDGITRILLIPAEVSWIDIANSDHFSIAPVPGLSPEHKKRYQALELFIREYSKLEKAYKLCKGG